MIIPNQYTQTTDPNSIIGVIGSYRVHSDMFKREITMSKYPAKDIEGQVGLDWMKNTRGHKTFCSYHAWGKWIQFSQCRQDRDLVAELGSFWDS